MDEPLTTAPLLGSPSVPPDHVAETSLFPEDGAVIIRDITLITMCNYNVIWTLILIR